MMKNKKAITLLLLLLLATVASFAQTDPQAPAFPGAEGYGRYTTGGRGGTIYHVTSLEDYCDNKDYSPTYTTDAAIPGTLRYAVRQSGARIVVFDVAGTIELKAPLKIQNDNISILGQTAPGDGICLKNHNVNISANNVIMRFVRCRMGKDGKRYYKDGAALTEQMIEDDALNSYLKTGNEKQNVIIDHCSVSWSVDECGSFYGNRNFTLQWCILSESLRNAGHSKGNHGYGGIWGGEKASFHHNLIADHDSRNPRFDHGYVSTLAGPVDYINNVVYNWGGNSSYGGENLKDLEAKKINMIGNYYKPGPYTTQQKTQNRLLNPTTQCDNCKTTAGAADKTDVVPGKFYLSDNIVNGVQASVSTTNITFDSNYTLDLFKANCILTSQAMSADANFTGTNRTTRHSASSVYSKVSDYVGASLSRDAVDARVINDMKNGTYVSGSNGSSYGLIDTPDDVGGYPVLSGSAKTDTDNDGIPDDWEDANGLDKNDASDASTYSLDSKGWYTNIEVYANSLVEDIMKAGNADAQIAVDEYYPVVAAVPGEEPEPVGVGYTEQGSWIIVEAGNADGFKNALAKVNADNASSSSTRKYIFMPNGTYDLGAVGMTELTAHKVSIIGESEDGVVIRNKMANADEGLGKASTLYIHNSQYTYLQDITIKNALDYYNGGGRAACLQDEGKWTIAKRVILLSYQDTYYSHKYGSQFYWEDSEIHGTVDFICGSGSAFFNRCLLYAESRTSTAGSGQCTLTAPSGVYGSYTDSKGNINNYQDLGYCFYNCTIDANCASYDLGRAWNNQPRSVYINPIHLQPSKLVADWFTLKGMSDGVVADVFSTYGSMKADGTALQPNLSTKTFADKSGNNAVSKSIVMTAADAERYTLANFYPNWQPDQATAQCVMSGLTASGKTIAWDAVANSAGYLIEKDGAFVGIATSTSFTVATDGTFSVRAANAHGGFGEGTEVVVGNVPVVAYTLDFEEASNDNYGFTGNCTISQFTKSDGKHCLHADQAGGSGDRTANIDLGSQNDAFASASDYTFEFDWGHSVSNLNVSTTTLNVDNGETLFYISTPQYGASTLYNAAGESLCTLTNDGYSKACPTKLSHIKITSSSAGTYLTVTYNGSVVVDGVKLADGVKHITTLQNTLGRAVSHLAIDDIKLTVYEEPVTPPAPIAVTTVIVSPANKTIAVGETLQLSAQVLPENASNKNVEWSSADAAIAQVNASGVVTANAVGTVNIVATAADGSEIQDFCVLTVTEKQTSETTRTIYSWESNGTVSESGGSIVETVGPNGTETPGTRINYRNTALGIEYKTICLTGKNDYSTQYMTITLNGDETIKEGDVISITAYRNKENTTSSSSAKIQFDNGQTVVIGEGADGVFVNLNASGDTPAATAPNTLSHVVTAAEAGGKSLKMTRGATATNLFITKIEITRSEASAPTTEYITKRISSSTWASFVPEKPVVVPEDVKVMYIKQNSYNSDSKTVLAVQIPTGTVIQGDDTNQYGYIINGDEGNHQFEVSLNDVQTFSDNILACGKNATIDDGSLVFARIDGVSGFYALDSYDICLPEGIVYLPVGVLSTVMQAPMAVAIVYDDAATAVTSCESASPRGWVYNMRGQRVDDTYRGMVIIDGKKIWRR